jgi:hypothetical protein
VRRRGALALVAVVAASLLHAAPAEAAPLARGCAPPAGSLRRSDGPVYDEHMWIGARTGRHACFDRIVFDMGIFDTFPPAERDGGAPGYTIRYVNRIWDGYGSVVPLPAGARLDIVIETANVCGYRCYPGYPGTEYGKPLPGVDVGGYRTFRSTVYAGALDGLNRVHIGLGVRARLPFRVFKLDERLVVDVYHHW